MAAIKGTCTDILGYNVFYNAINVYKAEYECIFQNDIKVNFYCKILT